MSLRKRPPPCRWCSRADQADDDAIELATTLQGLGAAYHQLGQYELALETFREGRRVVAMRVDSRHPLIVLSWENEAAALHTLERYE